ncbi:MAG: GNAT family N-acetyltransferase [Phycisphaerales bacterium]|nr:GNAT family N-acetyltransferase [Phycisphaerales bacterium]
MTHNPNILPTNLPAPTNDGAVRHLRAALLPALALPVAPGRLVDLSRLPGPAAMPVVLFCFPRTGVPGQPPSSGFHGEDWDSIPGARGCTPQNCGFRDLIGAFRELGAAVFGLSTSTVEHQQEFRARQHIPFDLLSDADLRLTRALNLPTFEFPIESGGPTTLLKRMAWYCEPDHTGRLRIVKVWYPVFPPDRNAQTVLDWLRRRAAITIRRAGPGDAEYIRGELTKHWGSTRIWSIGRAFEADLLPAFIAEHAGRRAGLLTYDLNHGAYQCEVVTVSSTIENAGVATRLLEAVEFEARRAGCTRMFLTTTNDNTKAIGFYQTRGWKLAALHKGNVEEARKRKTGIPLWGHHGIEIRDELELELWLE